ncbi:hypothetical protein BOX15_Mlig003614g1, partial [Macrostomum lignano]
LSKPLRKSVSRMSSSSDQPLVQRVLAVSAASAARASLVIRQVMSSGQLGIVEKGKNDLQTAADRGAQRIIIGNLRLAFPGLTVIGEEDEDPNAEPLRPDELVQPDAWVLAKDCPAALRDVPVGDVTVWVDPLDGTSEFAANLLDHVTVLIGIAVGSRAVAGVICQPYYNYQTLSPDQMGRLIWSLEGLGVFGLSETEIANNPPGNIIATTRSHSNQIVNDAVTACEPTEVLRVGGSGHKVLLLIERRAHAYVFASPGCKKWDTCAPEAVLRALGGCLTDILGNELPYDASATHPNKQGVLATLRKEDHARFAAKIPENVRKAMS